MTRNSPILLAVLALCAAFAVPALAQPKTQAAPASSGNTGPPNAVQGFSKNRDKPVHIEARRLEVRDKDKIATFFDNVQVIQGDTEMRCKTLVVYYEKEDDKNADPGKSASAASPGPGGEQKIKKMEARGGVVVTQNEQVATGESALFDMPTNTVTMIGNVVVTQGQSVLRGDRLVVDLTTGLSRVESGGKDGQGRVQGLFVPGSTSGPGAAKPEPPNMPLRPQRTN